MKRILYLITACWLLVLSCSKGESPAPHPGNYFPPVGSSTWETISPSNLNWQADSLEKLYEYLQAKKTKAFIILKDGRIVVEKYFGSFTRDSSWYWASAGKTVTALLAGIAYSEGKLDLDAPVSEYLGEGWTSLPAEKESLITVRHQLTMTTGLDDGAVTGTDCTLPDCLQYKADAGTRWAYHNAPYTLLEEVLEAATGKSFQHYFQEKIRDRIGMNGLWATVGFNNVYFSNARSMARMGLLLMHKGDWNGQVLLSNKTYYDLQVNSSQQFNLSYGYLTWLNGKTSYRLPGLQINFPGMLVPNAPNDMYAALGRDDQKIYVVPSARVVVIRMGEDTGNSLLAVSSFDNELWAKLKSIMKY